jgi:hypothetical protein
MASGVDLARELALRYIRSNKTTSKKLGVILVNQVVLLNIQK